MRRVGMLVLLLVALSVASTAFGQSSMPAAGNNLTIGLLMVGPYNDHGWSQAHYDAMQYVTGKVPGVQMIYLDKVNPADRPGTTASQLAESLVAKGAKLVIFSSDDMSDEAVKFAEAHTDIFVIMSSGSQVWKDGQNYQDLPT
jgi:simple sugar transport system substrate-binding protein